MHIACGAFTRALQSLVTLIDRKARAPRDHLLLEPVPAGVALTATDGTTSVRITLACDAPVLACVDARNLLAAARAASPRDLLTLTVVNGQVVVASPGTTTTLATIPPDSFGREIRAHDEVLERRTVDAAAFLPALSWVARAMGTEDPTRNQLAGVLLAGDRVVATDGKRLHVAWVQGMALYPTQISAKAIALLLRASPATGELEVATHGSVVQFTAGAWTIRTRAMGHTAFPPYQAVIPDAASAAFTIQLEASGLEAALERVGVRGKANAPLSMRCNGRIVLSLVGEGARRVAEIEVAASTHDAAAADFVLAVDGRYLRDAVAGDGAATLRFYADLRPLVVDSGARLAVVMPMRL